MLPTKTTVEDFDVLSTYLKSQVGWVSLERVGKAIDKKYVDGRKLEAQKRLGFIERDGANLKLSERGRAYTLSSDMVVKAQMMEQGLREIPLFVETIEWMHYSKVVDPGKTDVGNYWHDKHQAQLEGAKGTGLTDAVIFFLRVAAAAGLGKFTRGAQGRPNSYLKTDAEAIEKFVLAKRPEVGRDDVEEDSVEQDDASQPVRTESPNSAIAPAVSLTASPAVHVNLEIHIAADATAETVAEIFKSMRKYVLSNPEDVDS